MNTITINGKTISSFGSISILNGRIMVDGDNVTIDDKVISIVVTGDCPEISADACESITVGGNADYVKTMSGSVKVQGNVTGDIKTMSGSVKCGTVGGSIKTMSGDISNKK